MWGRRELLKSTAGVGLSCSIAGCTSNTSGDSDIKDTDGDGVIDSEDYAPRDPEVQRAEQVKGSDSTPTETPTETPTQTPNAGKTVVDGFEDGDTVGWKPLSKLTSTFEASEALSNSGSYSAKFSEGEASDNPKWAHVGDAVMPNTVETAHALGNGEIYSDSFTEWVSGDTIVLRVNYNWSNNFLAINGSGAQPSDIENGAVVADLPWPSTDQFFHVVLEEINWGGNVVGKVRVNGEVRAEDVPFFEEADGIDRTTVRIGGGGGNLVFVDDTTVPMQ